jgi:signal transduction histidine kinase
MGVALRDGMLRDLDGDLHDLCQPLTTLQGRLELAQLLGDAQSLKEAVASGVVEAQRICSAVERMRERMLRVSSAL